MEPQQKFWDLIDSEADVTLESFLGILSAVPSPYESMVRRSPAESARIGSPKPGDVHMWSRVLFDGVRWGSSVAIQIMKNGLLDAIERCPPSVVQGHAAGLVAQALSSHHPIEEASPDTIQAIARALNASQPTAMIQTRKIAQRWLRRPALGPLLEPGWQRLHESEFPATDLPMSFPASEALDLKRRVVTGPAQTGCEDVAISARPRYTFVELNSARLVNHDGKLRSGWSIFDLDDAYVPRLSFGCATEHSIGEIEIPGTAFLVDDRFAPNLAHLLLDKAPRLLLLKSYGLAPTPVIIHESSMTRELLQLLGLPPAICIPKGWSARIGKLILPRDAAETRHLLAGVAPGARELVCSWLRSFAVKSSDLLFASRSDATKRNILNEESVLNSIPGAVAVNLGDLSLRDQIALVMGAETVVGVHGANLALAALRENGGLVEILPPGRMGTHSFFVAQQSWVGVKRRYIAIGGKGRQPSFSMRTMSDQSGFEVDGRVVAAAIHELSRF